MGWQMWSEKRWKKLYDRVCVACELFAARHGFLASALLFERWVAWRERVMPNEYDTV